MEKSYQRLILKFRAVQNMSIPEVKLSTLGVSVLHAFFSQAGWHPAPLLQLHAALKWRENENQILLKRASQSCHLSLSMMFLIFFLYVLDVHVRCQIESLFLKDFKNNIYFVFGITFKVLIPCLGFAGCNANPPKYCWYILLFGIIAFYI